MWSALLVALALAYAGGALRARRGNPLARGAYPSPEQAEREIELLAAAHPKLCERSVFGRSSEGRPLHALRLRPAAAAAGDARPRLLVGAGIHAVEYVGSWVARALARRLAEGYSHDAEVTALLDRADVVVAPLLNPDGAARVWRRGGFGGLGAARFTANGVDPNRNFPFLPAAGREGWNTGSARPGSPYYRGPHPLSEPECLALARLCLRERFCAAIQFHSFGGVVYLPQLEGAEDARAREVLSVFEGDFQSRQRFRRYRPVPERSAKIVGQLDPFLLAAFGTPSVTVEVSRPGLECLWPSRLFHVFSWANPSQPRRWAENDVDATLHALGELLRRSGGVPCAPAHPELADAVPA